MKIITTYPPTKQSTGVIEAEQAAEAVRRVEIKV